MSDTVRVRATSIGYYGHQRRKVGECFFIDGKLTKNVAGREDGEIQAFSDKWMVKVDEKATDEIEERENYRTPVAVSKVGKSGKSAAKK